MVEESIMAVTPEGLRHLFNKRRDQPNEKARMVGRANKKRGDAVERRVGRLLSDMGYVMVEKVNTPWKIIRAGGKIVDAVPERKVSGDFRGVNTLGQSMLCEVKSRATRLPWSAFEPHQIEALDEHAKYSAHTWVFFHDTTTDRISRFRWPVDGFGPGQSLKPKGE